MGHRGYEARKEPKRLSEKDVVVAIVGVPKMTCEAGVPCVHKAGTAGETETWSTTPRRAEI